MKCADRLDGELILKYDEELDGTQYDGYPLSDHIVVRPHGQHFKWKAEQLMDKTVYAR